MAEQRAVVSPARHCSLLMGKGSSLALLTRNMGFSKASVLGLGLRGSPWCNAVCSCRKTAFGSGGLVR